MEMSTEVLNIKSFEDYELLGKQFSIITNTQKLLREGKNLADIIWDVEHADDISKKQIPSIVHTLLIEKLNYSCLSFNLSATPAEWSVIHKTMADWNQFDTVIAYYHPQLDISLINPSNAGHWERIESFSPYELVVIYAKAREIGKETMAGQYLADVKALCNGYFSKDPSLYRSEKTEFRAEPETPEPPAAAAQEAEPVTEQKPTEQDEKKKRVTPKYAVQVTNELFHNGNVEAWRNIIESYEKKYPGTTILLYHNGQRIKHISSLFKWGKVKVGDSIFFSLVGEDLKDIAKLKKYLFQGASHNFKYFVKKDVNTVLSLF